MTSWLILEMIIGLIGGFCIGIIISLMKVSKLERTIERASSIIGKLEFDITNRKDMAIFEAYKVLNGVDDRR